MAHFAKIGLNSKVILVVRVPDENILNADGIADEKNGISFLERTHGWPIWVQCSINTSNNKHYQTNKDGTRILSDTQEKAFRGNFPAVGDIWDDTRKIFYVPKKFDSMIWNDSKCTFEYCVKRPDNNSFLNSYPNKYIHLDWDETETTWKGKSELSEIYVWDKLNKVWNLK